MLGTLRYGSVTEVFLSYPATICMTRVSKSCHGQTSGFLWVSEMLSLGPQLQPVFIYSPQPESMTIFSSVLLWSTIGRDIFKLFLTHHNPRVTWSTIGASPSAWQFTMVFPWGKVTMFWVNSFFWETLGHLSRKEKWPIQTTQKTISSKYLWGSQWTRYTWTLLNYLRQ